MAAERSSRGSGVAGRLVERLGKRVPAQGGALDANGELHDAFERFEVAQSDVAGVGNVGINAHLGFGTIAAELAFARLEIAALQHDNAVLASENRVLANARNLPEVVADVREYIRHVVDGDDAVPCKPEV